MWRIAATLAIALAALGGCHEGRHQVPVEWTKIGSAAAAEPASFDSDPHDHENIAVPPPPFSKRIYPCTQCHDQEFEAEPYELEEDHLKIVLKHGTRRQWCYDCHNPADRDTLRLAGGTTVPFEESYLLCGQCHGPKLRDWRAGVHGKRTGSWSGKKRYLLCVHCHDPHAPRFKPVEPEPIPHRPLMNGSQSQSEAGPPAPPEPAPKSPGS